MDSVRAALHAPWVVPAALLLAIAVPTRLVATLTSGQTRLTLLNVVALLSPLGATIVLAVRARRLRGRPRLHLVLLSLSVASWTLGQAYWVVSEVLLHHVQPFPSWADAGYLLFFPPLLAALVLAPSSRLHRVSRYRLLVDTIAVSSALLLLVWSTVLLSVLDFSAATGLVEATVGLAYPSLDLVLLGVALTLWQGANKAWTAPIRGYALALLLLLVADGGFALLVAGNTYATGSWVDLGWVLGFPMLALAARGVQQTEESRDEPVAERAWAANSLPTAAFGVSCVLAVVNVMQGTFQSHPLLLFLMTCIFVAAIVRAVTARSEGEAYARQLAATAETLSSVQLSHDVALHAANMVAWSWQANQDRWSIGPESAKRLGIESEALSGSLEQLLERVAPEDRNEAAAAFAAVRRSRPVYDVEFGLVDGEGTIHLRTRGQARYSDSEELLELTGVLFDISETRQARLLQARREANAAAVAALSGRLPQSRSLEEGYDDALGTLAVLLEAGSCELWRHDQLVACWPRPSSTLPDEGAAPAPEFVVRVGPLTWGTLSVRLRAGVLTPEAASLAASVASLLGASIERAEAQSRLWHAARHDALTGLPNRVLFGEHLSTAVGSLGQGMVAVAYLDLDDFKRINDRFGHPVGDALLVVVATRLQACLRPGDLVARLGGDEFAIVMCGVESPSEAMEVAERVQRRLAVEADLGPTTVRPRAAIGIATTAEAGCGIDLLRNADLAMYVAKRDGSRRAVLFESRFHDEATAEGALGDDLRGVLERGELVLHYQPVVELRTGALCGAEALLRWQRPGQGLCPPSDFLPSLERIGLMGKVTAFVLAEACAWARAYLDSHVPGKFTVAVNLTPADVMSPDFAELVIGALAAARLEPARLILEIVESGVLADMPAAAEALKFLRSRGVRIAIDDFGTGYSSMSQLKALPVDIVKIDKNFVNGLATAMEDSALVSAVISMAHTLGLDVVAEGIETDKQRSALIALGCEMAQGYHFGRPVPAEPGSFALPTRPIEEVTVPQPRAAQEGPSHRARTVVIADDLEDDRRILARFLARSGEFVLVGEASDGAGAVRLVRERRPDLALLDVSMPVLDGFDALARIRAETPATQVVLLSGYVSDVMVRAALEGGARGCLAKGPSDVSAQLVALLEATEVHHVR